MGRRTNEMFIGAEHMSADGSSIKHPALISLYANVNANKIKSEPIELIGLDLETNHLTGELRLLGIYDGKNYTYHTSDFIDILFAYCKYASFEHYSFAYWNRLDPFVIYKQFLLLSGSDETVQQSMERFAKIGGEWDRKEKRWTLPPVIEIEYGDYYFGIRQVVRSSIQFFYRKKDSQYLDTIWAYDIAQLYEESLEATALGPEDKDEEGNKLGTYSNKRLNYYSKVDKSAHLVDWERYATDKEYQTLVLKSNELDSRAVYDLGYQIQQEFYTAFTWYPNTIVSTGSLARSAVVAVRFNHYEKKLKLDRKNEEDCKTIMSFVDRDIKSIGFINHMDSLIATYGEDLIKDLYALSFEAYSGGYIETIRYGYAEKGYIADITSAYPATIVNLYDLTNCKISTGIGEPPHKEYSYCLIRGLVSIPYHVNYHSITVKHPVDNTTNIRAVGEYYASYTIEERDFLLEQGATFMEETWYLIETEGKLSPLAESCQTFYDLRMKLRAENNSAQYMAKIAMNSLYGILFEAVDTYVYDEKEIEQTETVNEGFYRKQLGKYRKSILIKDIKHHLEPKLYQRWYGSKGSYYPDDLKNELRDLGIYLESDNPIDIMIEIDRLYTTDKAITETFKIKESKVLRMGYRGGEFLNAIYATQITSQTRIMLARASLEIERKGGKPILLMTDSITWEGTADMLPKSLWREKKTLGYFEKPEEIYNIVCLGAGRYEYQKKNKKGVISKSTSKKRGLNITDLHDPDGIIVNDFNWLNALKIMARTGKDKIDVKVRRLISVGLVLHNHQYTFKDLGLVVENITEVEAVVGHNKRNYDDSIKDPIALANSLVDTEPLILAFGMLGTPEYQDQTLPTLRKLFMAKKYVSPKEKRKKSVRKAVKKFKAENHDEIKDARKKLYNDLKEYGYDSKTATKMSHWGFEKITTQLRKDKKI